MIRSCSSSGKSESFASPYLDAEADIGDEAGVSVRDGGGDELSLVDGEELRSGVSRNERAPLVGVPVAIESV